MPVRRPPSLAFPRKRGRRGLQVGAVIVHRRLSSLKAHKLAKVTKCDTRERIHFASSSLNSATANVSQPRTLRCWPRKHRR